MPRPERPPVTLSMMEEAMRNALEEASRAATHGDVPVGAVVMVDGAIIASAHNEKELRGDPTAHAEMLALRMAAGVLGTWHMEEATVVVTLEPCPMCAGALVAARVKALVFGATDPKAGACGSLYNLCSDPRLNHEVTVTPGVLADECGTLLTEFFSGLRATKGSSEQGTRETRETGEKGDKGNKGTQRTRRS